MVGILPRNHASKKSFLALFLCFLVVFGLASSMLAKPADAKTVRLALVTSIEGSVTVKKGGGSMVYDAYTDMSLNQGDTLYTGDSSSVVLDVSGGDSEITIGANSEFNISDLAESGGKKSKLKSWAGSMWVKVKSLAGSNDEFEVETPTAVMGVRGTHFFVGVDPVTGETTLAVGSGKVEAEVSSTDGEQGSNSNNSVVLLPTQQLVLESRDETEDLSLKVDLIDIEKLIEGASPAVIEAIIRNKQAIDEENEKFVQDQKEQLEQGGQPDAKSTLSIKDAADLDKVTQNLNNLIGNIAKSAVDSKKVEQAIIQKIIDTINKSITDPNKKLDLNNVKPMDKTAGVDPEKEKQKQEALKKLEEEKQKKKETEKKLLEESKKKLEEALKKLEEEKKRIDEANKKAAADARAKAEADLKKKLSDAEKEKFEQDKKNIVTPTPTTSPVPTTPPVVNPGTNPGTTPDNGGGGDPVEPAKPVGLVELDAPTSATILSPYFNLGLDLSNFVQGNEFYAVEVHLVYNDPLKFYPFNEIGAAAIFDENISVQSVNEYTGTIGTNEEIQRELVYVITNFNTDVQYTAVNKTRLINLPFYVGSSGTASVRLAKVIIVDKSGDPVEFDFSDAIKTITVTGQAPVLE
jgi:hypothetical protein